MVLFPVFPLPFLFFFSFFLPQRSKPCNKSDLVRPCILCAKPSIWISWCFDLILKLHFIATLLLCSGNRQGLSGIRLAGAIPSGWTLPCAPCLCQLQVSGLLSSNTQPHVFANIVLGGTWDLCIFTWCLCSEVCIGGSRAFTVQLLNLKFGGRCKILQLFE